LQIVDESGNVLQEESREIKAGATVEWSLIYIIAEAPNIPVWSPPRSLIKPLITPPLTDDPLVDTGGDGGGISFLFRVRLIQRGASNDAWKVDRLSLHDEMIRWEFSCDGGETFVPAYAIHNNPFGILTFEEPGDALVWRVTGYRENLNVSSLQVRPTYVGKLPVRIGLIPHRGSNRSAFDQDPPINDDPEFRVWSYPVPREWFLAGAKFPELAIFGQPDTGPFSRFYLRTTTESIPDPIVTASALLLALRSVMESIPEPDDTITTSGTFARTVDESSPEPSDMATAYIVEGDEPITPLLPTPPIPPGE
jgi:hypothetical protein